MYVLESPRYTRMARKVNPNPLAPFFIKIGGFKFLARGETSLEGEPSRELVLELGDSIGWEWNSSEKTQSIINTNNLCDIC